MKMIKQALLTCLMILLPAVTFAATPWYQVELLIFANDDPSALDDEFWPADLHPPLNNKAVNLSRTTQTGSYTLMPNQSLLFSAEKRRIQSYNGFRVLFHGAWKQPVTTKRYAKSVRIRGGQLLDNGQYELDGFITIDRGRFLHFRPDLYLNRQLNQREQNMLLSFESQQQTLPSDPISDENLSEDGLIGLSPTSFTEAETGLELPNFLTVQMNQGRRMRSKEVHYIDHPMMGVLVLMLPLKTQKTE